MQSLVQEQKKQVHYRTGSLEIDTSYPLRGLPVHYRTGSLENTNPIFHLKAPVHYRTGSLETLITCLN